MPREPHPRHRKTHAGVEEEPLPPPIPPVGGENLAGVVYDGKDEWCFWKLLIAIVIVYFLYSVWYNVLDVFAYETLGLKRDRLLDVLLVAVVVTVILFTYLAFLGKHGDKIKQQTIGFGPRDAAS